MTKKERNMLYYQENRERLKARARERRRERRQKALKMVKGEGREKPEPKSQGGDIQPISIFQAEHREHSDVHAETIAVLGSVQNKSQLLTETSSLESDGSEAETSQRSDRVQKVSEYTETVSEPPSNPDVRSAKRSASGAETLGCGWDLYEHGSAWVQQSLASFELMEVSFEYWPMEAEEFQLNITSTTERVQHSEGTSSETSSTEPVDAELSTPRSEESSPIAERVQPESWSRPNRKPKWYKGWTDLIAAILSSPSTLFRLLLVAGLTSLLTVLQVAFYREHDIDPSLAIPLALACELSLISLVMMGCRSKLENFLRCAAYAILFGYVIGSLGFDVLHNMRLRAQHEQVSPAESIATMENLQARLDQAQRSLDAATKGRSWENMIIFGKQVEDMQVRIDEIQNQTSLGLSDSQMIQGSLVLIILFRAVIMIVNSLNAHMLRERCKF